MNAVSNNRPVAVHVAVDQLLSEYGRFAVLRAVLRGLSARPAPKERDLPLGLSDHLLRDIGLFDQDLT